MKKGFFVALIATAAAIGAGLAAILAISKRKKDECDDFDELYFEDEYTSEEPEQDDEDAVAEIATYKEAETETEESAEASASDTEEASEEDAPAEE